MASMAEETLREAACAGDDATVRSLIAKGVPVNSQHAINKWTALHWAVHRNHDGIVRILLAAGADPTLEDAKGRTPASLSRSEKVQDAFGTSSGGVGSTSAASANFTPNFTPAYMRSPDFPYTKQYEQPSLPPPPSSTPSAAPRAGAVLPVEAKVLKHIHALLRATTLPSHIAEALGLLALQGDARVRILWEAFSTDEEAFVRWGETLAKHVHSEGAGAPRT